MIKKTIGETEYFRFLRSKYSSSGANAHPIYIIDARKGWSAMSLDMEEIRDIIDPERNISGKNGTRWKFRNYEDAAKIWTYLMLKY